MGRGGTVQESQGHTISSMLPLQQQKVTGRSDGAAVLTPTRIRVRILDPLLVAIAPGPPLGASE